MEDLGPVPFPEAEPLPEERDLLPDEEAAEEEEEEEAFQAAGPREERFVYPRPRLTRRGQPRRPRQVKGRSKSLGTCGALTVPTLMLLSFQGGQENAAPVIVWWMEPRVSETGKRIGRRVYWSAIPDTAENPVILRDNLPLLQEDVVESDIGVRYRLEPPGTRGGGEGVRRTWVHRKCLQGEYLDESTTPLDDPYIDDETLAEVFDIDPGQVGPELNNTVLRALALGTCSLVDEEQYRREQRLLTQLDETDDPEERRQLLTTLRSIRNLQQQGCAHGVPWNLPPVSEMPWRLPSYLRYVAEGTVANYRAASGGSAEGMDPRLIIGLRRVAGMRNVYEDNQENIDNDRFLGMRPAANIGDVNVGDVFGTPLYNDEEAAEAEERAAGSQEEEEEQED